MNTNDLEMKCSPREDIYFYLCSFFSSPITVPPSIIAKETSTDMVVREASNVTLTCKAAGYPEPYVMWRREDGENINYNGESGECSHEFILKSLVFYIFAKRNTSQRV